jgi:hypothetical protein
MGQLINNKLGGFKKKILGDLIEMSSRHSSGRPEENH